MRKVKKIIVASSQVAIDVRAVLGLADLGLLVKLDVFPKPL